MESDGVTVGVGHSSPVVVGDRVFLHARQGEDEVVAAYDLSTGKQVWRDSYPTPYTMHEAAVGHGKGPKSTPVYHAGKLYTLGISGILSAYDAPSGKRLWRKEFSQQYKLTSPDFGAAMSPVVDNGLLIAHVGGRDSGALTAFDANTGAVKWAWKGDGPGYASPIVAVLGGVRQVVTQTQRNIIGVSAADGSLLWRVPFTTEYEQNIVTPVLYKDTLILSGIAKGTFAVRPVKRGNQWAAEPVWKNDGVAFYMSSPVLSGDRLFGMSHYKKGQYVCLDARTGKTLWLGEGRVGENAAVLSAGDVLLLLNNDAELTVAKKSGGGFAPLRKYTVAASPTWAHPVMTGKGILVKDEATLTLLGLE